MAVTEALSAFTALRVPTVALAWSLFAGVTLVVLVRRRVVIPSLPPLASVTVAERVGIGVLAVASALLCFLALYGAPNSFDGMAYHLPRVVHWIQNESVRHYPTNVSRQDWMSPFAEFVMFHLHLLAGADWLDNLVQWLAMLGSLVVVSLVAKELGASRRGQLFAAILCATMPMGILAATSTKNDYVAAFWLLSAAYFLLVLLGADRRGETTRGYTMLFGASVGLALLTKGTSYIFVLPFLAWFAVEGLIHSPLRLLKRATVAAAIAVLVNAPSYARNVVTFGGPLGPPGQDGATTMLLFAPRRSSPTSPRSRSRRWGLRTVGSIAAWRAVSGG